MVKVVLCVVVSVVSLVRASAAETPWPPPRAPIVPEADGYVAISTAVVPPDAKNTYRAVYDANRAADDPSRLVPAINMLGSELNAMAVEGVPKDHVKFVLVFHGAAMDGLLDDQHYKAKYKVANPNLKALDEMKKAGVELFVCGQNLAFAKIDPHALTPLVAVASDALIVLMTYQNKGYALLSF